MIHYTFEMKNRFAISTTFSLLPKTHTHLHPFELTNVHIAKTQDFYTSTCVPVLIFASKTFSSMMQCKLAVLL